MIAYSVKVCEIFAINELSNRDFKLNINGIYTILTLFLRSKIKKLVEILIKFSIIIVLDDYMIIYAKYVNYDNCHLNIFFSYSNR